MEISGEGFTIDRCKKWLDFFDPCLLRSGMGFDHWGGVGRTLKVAKVVVVNGWPGLELLAARWCRRCTR